MKTQRFKTAGSLVSILVLLCTVLDSARAATLPPTTAGAWWGEYFANRTLSGSPAVTRYDDEIKFGWGGDSPGSGIPEDNFSVRWTRDEWFAGGTYRFTILSDDGVRIWVGNQLVADEWRDRWAVPLYLDRVIPEGIHPVRVEYFDHRGDATISVAWNRLEGGGAWRGEYFSNYEVSGDSTVVRADSAIDFDWGNGSPDPALPADYFSVRWTRTLGFDAGTHRFFTSTDDGVRVWVDGNLLIDAWNDQKLPNTHTSDVYLAAGQHTIVVEYYEHGGEAHAHVWWRSQETFANWYGQYFDNPDLAGGPALERDDAEIAFDWGVQAPVAWMPDDNFAIRWTRTVNFAPGYYRLAIRADDGVRLWLDESLIIDKWEDMDYELHYVDGTYLEGSHTIRVEYHEHTGHARVRVWWETSSDSNSPPTMDPGPPPATGGGAATGSSDPWSDELGSTGPWAAAYFANVTLNGQPVLVRTENALDQNWGWGSPGQGVPSNYFSARWTGSLDLSGGTYRFTTYTDDGLRLWVDGRLLLSSWRPMRGERAVTIRLDEGTHNIAMEYYERTGIALARLTWRQVSQ